MPALSIPCLALITALSAGQSTSSRATTPDLISELKTIHRLRNSPRAAVGLWSLATYEGLASHEDRRAILRTLSRLVKNRRTPLSVRRLAARLLARALEKAGQDQAAQDVQDRLGWIRHWWTIGPLPNDAREGFEHDYGPEARIALEGTLSTKGGPVGWKPYPIQPRDGRIRLHPIFLPRSAIAAYAVSGFEIERKQEILLHAGCDDACKIWLDGSLVLTDPGLHSHQADQHSVAVRLKPGAHRILVKVVQDTGAMGFSLALTDPNGRPPRGLRFATRIEDLEKQIASTPEAPLGIQVREGLAAWFDKQATAFPKDGRRRAEAGWADYHTSVTDRRNRRPEQLLQEALDQLEPDSPESLKTLLRLARVIDDDNQSLRLLEQAAQRFPEQPAALARIGLHHQVRGEYAKALTAHGRVLAKTPGHLASQLGRAEVLYDLGLEALSRLAIERLAADHPDRPEVLTAAANLYRRMGYRQRAASLYRSLLELDAVDPLALRALHELEVEAGNLDAALDWLTRLQRRDPLRVDWWIQRGELLQANGRFREAMAAFDKAVSICPADPRPWVERGEGLLQVGRLDDALTSWRHSLDLAPQDHGLQRRIQALSPQRRPFYEPWLVDPRDLRTGQAEPVAAGAERLLDNQVIRLHPNGMASRFRQQVVRLDNQQGVERFRTFRVEYAPGRQEVRVLMSRVWHADGRTDSSVLTDDFSLSEPWYNLYYDVHAREITFPDLRPGDRIELTTLVEDEGGGALLSDYFGDLVPLQFAEPVAKASYVVLVPADRQLAHHHPAGLVDHKVEKEPEGGEIHTWTAENLPAVEPEPNMPGFTETNAHLHLSTFTSWIALSRWFGARIADQMIAGSEVQDLAAQLTAGLTDPLDKIRSIYRFVADGTRYVGLEFGIHSYVPYQCTQVLQRKFGDCKDKSALMVALFESVGIKARMALVRMQRLGRFAEGRPAAAESGPPASLAVFNHAICFLPGHDLWLDGTAALHDILDLPAQDQGVQALVIGPEGDRLVDTPTTGADRNWTDLDFDVAADQDGSARMTVQLAVSGTLAPEVRMRFLGGKPAAATFSEIVQELFAGAQVLDAEVANQADPRKPVVIKADLKIPELGQRRKAALTLPALAKDTSYQRTLASTQTRHHALLLGPAWAVHWRVRIRPPSGHSLPTAPPSVRLESPHGWAEISHSVEGDTVTTRADFTLTSSRIPAADYAAFRDFLGEVDRLFSRHLQFDRRTDAG